MKRQALYACVTCIPESKTDPSKRAGVCLACSYSCHENHELIELYTKRNFRCDCGNSKFGEKKCNLEAEKSATNVDNIYNNNFSGLYCNCKRPYPDPEDSTVDDMIQCVVCEDWYHCRHLGSYVPPMSSYSEMICGNCISNHGFILNYHGYAITKAVEEPPSDPVLPKIVKVENETETIEVANETKDEEKTTKKNMECTKSMDCTKSTDCTNTDNAIGDGSIGCKMPKTKSELNGALFWPDNWRQFLCTCADCMALYEAQNVGYLTDMQDTVHFYEEKGKAKALENSESQYEQGMKALSSLDRVKQVEVVSEYNAMKDQLKEYLQKFADNKKIVREEDIREFFSTMAARKKQKVDMPYFCR